METVMDFIFLGSKITADSDCSHEIKRWLLLGRKAVTNLDSILKSRDTTLQTKIHISQSCGFSSSHVQMWELDHKKAEHRRIDAFKLGCWRRCLRVLWTSRRSNQSILKEINPECSLEELIRSSNTLATWWKELTHWKRPWCWEKLRAGEEVGNRGWDG